MSQPSPHVSLADRARLKERDENVCFKQSMTPHVSCEGLVPWKLEANGNASRLNPMVGFVCGFGSCGDLHIEHPQTARAHRDAPWCVSALGIAGKRSAQSWPLRVKQRTREPSRRTISR